MARIQFILKSRETPFVGEVPADRLGGKQMLSSGLLNSATFMADMLRDDGHTVELVHAIDNNCIDRFVTKFKPQIVVIEAYWVVPDKFRVLTKLHPKVTWVIRNHSAIPFVASEGIAMDWSLRYTDYPGVVLASNDARANKEFHDLVSVYKPTWSAHQIDAQVTLLPNFYPGSFKPRVRRETDVIDIACFGAMRPLKNHLAQAVAAIQYAKKVNKHLRFHINSTRIEMKGEPILHNLQKLFALLPHELVEHPWLPHSEFCELLRGMDVAMQVSYTETFNIVSADAIVNGVPIMTSPDILWADPAFQADPNSTDDMVRVLEVCFARIRDDTFWQRNLQGLNSFAANSRAMWAAFIEADMAKRISS